MDCATKLNDELNHDWLYFIAYAGTNGANNDTDEAYNVRKP